jgi:hypothetical protein
VEQTSAIPPTGQIDLFNVTLGGSGVADTIAAASPAMVPVTTSTNESKPDIDNPLNTLFDPGGDLFIGNGNDGGHNHGTMACVPASAITTNVNASTTVSATVTSPLAMAFIILLPSASLYSALFLHQKFITY